MRNIKVRVMFLVAALSLLVYGSPSDAAKATGQKVSLVGEMLRGQDKGNGADYASESVDAESWFSGPSTVIYCIEAASDFPVDRSKLQKKVADVIGQWVQLVNTSDRYYFNEVLKYLALDFRESGICTAHTDLKFYFGTTSPEIEAARKAHNDKAVAIAQQTSIDRIAGRSKGFIWLAPQGSLTNSGPAGRVPQTDTFPNWTIDFQLHALLLHEVGHVFGADHVSGTIMRKEIANCMRKDPLDSIPPVTDYFYHINEQRMILAPVTSTYEFPGKLGFQPYPQVSFPSNYTQQEAIFQIMMGRKAKGQITAKAVFKGDYGSPAILKMTVGDASGAQVFEFSMDTVSWEMQRTEWGPSRGMTVITASRPEHPFTTDSDGGHTYLGSVKTARGESLQIMAQVNTYDYNSMGRDQGPLVIGFLDNDKVWKRMFQANLNYQAF